MKRIILYYVLLSLSIGAFSQQKKTKEFFINGFVYSDANQAIPFCNIALYNQADSMMVAGCVSNENGNFELLAAPGNYYLRISYLSYEPKIVDNIEVRDQGIDFGIIILQESTNIIDEVVVSGEKSQMELQFEKKVFNVGKDITNTGENGAEVLANIPSVSVNQEGKVSLRGSENVRILIDGKPSALIGSKSGTGLRQLQGNLIESVEVITNPSARYDAAGDAGIINIVLKKTREKGINGTFTLNSGYPDNYGGSYSINYRRKNINLFSNCGILYHSVQGDGNSSQRYTGIDTSYFYLEKNKHIRNSLSNNFTLGLDYFLNKTTTVTLSFVYERARENNNFQIEYQDFDADNKLSQTTRRINDEVATENNFETNLVLKKEFEQEGREFTFDFKWIQSTEPENNDIQQISTNPESNFLQKSGNTENEYRYLFQADYMHPFGSTFKIESGLKSSFRLIKSNYFLEQQDEEFNWILIPDFSNHFVYNENIHAAYFMGSLKFNKILVQAGLRGEYSDILAQLKETNNSVENVFFDLFPSASLSYKIKEPVTLQVNYSYRINRPGFWDLLPFNDFTDNRVIRKGNPELKPEYTNSYELGMLVKPESFAILSTFYYRNKTGAINHIEKNDTADHIQIMPVNMQKENLFGFELNASANIKKWCILNTNFNFYKAVTNGTFDNQEYASETYSWTNKTDVKFLLPGNWDMQVAFDYHAPFLSPQRKNSAYYSIDAGLSKKVLDGKGTFNFSVKDLFNTRRDHFITEDNGYYSDRSFQWMARQVKLSFVYRLNRDNDESAGIEEDDD